MGRHTHRLFIPSIPNDPRVGGGCGTRWIDCGVSAGGARGLRDHVESSHRAGGKAGSPPTAFAAISSVEAPPAVNEIGRDVGTSIPAPRVAPQYPRGVMRHLKWTLFPVVPPAYHWARCFVH